jgi:GT2 family glycosyltransferase
VADVSVVVATRNRRASLLRTLRHLRAMPERPPVIVVDNASSDGSADAVAAAYPDVAVLALDRNLGAVARNLGVARAATPYVAFADDDSWWAPGSLARAAAALAAHPRLAVVAARVLVGAEHRPDPLCTLMRDSPLGRAPDLPGPSVLGFLACAAVLRRSAFHQVGGFDDLIFFLGEEELLAWDLAARGWGLAYVDSVVAHHHPAPTAAGRGSDRARLQRRNALLSAWLRRPAPSVLRVTLRAARTSRRDPDARAALLAAARRLPSVARRRRALPVSVEQQLRLLEASA